VEADSGGIYTPPDGATSGPYATEAEALEACPFPPLEITCGECTQLHSVPRPLVLSFVNQTPGLGLANSYWMDFGVGCDGAFACIGSTGTNPRQVKMTFGCGGGDFEDLVVQIYFTVTHFGIDSGGTLQPGWSDSTFSGVLLNVVPCGDTFDTDQFIGRVKFVGIAEYVGGEADVYLSRP